MVSLRQNYQKGRTRFVVVALAWVHSANHEFYLYVLSLSIFGRPKDRCSASTASELTCDNSFLMPLHTRLPEVAVQCPLVERPILQLISTSPDGWGWACPKKHPVPLHEFGSSLELGDDMVLYLQIWTHIIPSVSYQWLLWLEKPFDTVGEILVRQNGFPVGLCHHN